MKVFIVGAGPGDPELLTRKAYALIRRARVCIYAGSLIPPAVTRLLPARCEKHDSSALTMEEMATICRAARRRRRNVVRLHSGDLSLYSSAGEEMEMLRRAGIAAEWVPGISAFQAASSRLQREFTAPGITQTIILSRAAGRTPVPAREALDRLARCGATLALYLSVHAAAQVRKQLLPRYGADCPVAICANLARRNERIVMTTLGQLARTVRRSGIRKTALLVVGRALADAGERSRLYDPGFAHGCRPARQ